MATHTTNFNLIKPEATDLFELFRQWYNDNLDIIDANLGGGGGSSSLAGLSDVDLTTPTDGQVLTYDGINSKWVNANGGGGGGDTVSWTQIQQSGTKIAEIDINGTSQNVYAPSGGGGGGGLIYSETEQVIGEFCGKPLYQICIPFSGITIYGNSTYNWDVTAYAVNYERLFLVHDMCYYLVNGTIQRSFVYPNTSPVQPPNVILGVEVTRSNISGHITVRYTKTTD